MIFCWNIRGLNGRKKRRAVGRWMAINKPIIGGFLETRVRQNNILAVRSRTLHGWSYDVNYSPEALNGRIVAV